MPDQKTPDHKTPDQKTGHCLCQAVQYVFFTTPLAAVHCHCIDCQRATGSGYATVFGLLRSDVAISGEANLSHYSLAADSGQRVTRSFCRQCGSPLFTEADNNPELIWIKAGSLNDGGWLEPTDACWTGSAQNWAPAQNGVAHHAGNP